MYEVIDGVKEAGWHTATFEPGDLSAGVYIVRMQAGSITDAKQMVLAR